MASLTGFESAALRIGESLNICHLYSPIYTKVAIRQAFSYSESLRVRPSSPVHFNSFLDFFKKGSKNTFYLSLFLSRNPSAV